MRRPVGGNILATFGLTPAIVLGVATVAAAVCTVTIDDFDGNGSSDLRVVGDGAGSILTIRDHPGIINQAFIFLDCDGDGVMDPGDLDGGVGHPGGFEVVDLQLGGGDDRVTIEVPEGALYTDKNRNFVVDLGPGKNRFRFDHPGADDFAFTAENSRITIDVRGGSGADNVGFRFNGAIASTIVLRADLAGGPDVVSLDTSFIARYEVGSIVNIEFQMGAGSDRVNYQPTADPVDGSVYRVRIVGDDGADVVNGGIFSLIGDNASLLFSVDLGAGDDRLTLSPPPLVDDLGTVHVDVAGGDGHDVLSIAPTSPGWTSRLGGRVEMFVHGNDGNDQITVNMSPDIGSETSGLIRVHADGGAGNDRVFAAVDAMVGSTGKYDFLLRGGVGTDFLQLTVLNHVSNPNGPSTYPPAGAALMDGGVGTDECKVVGNPLVWKQNCESSPPPTPTD
jgi:hypothetical protein